MKIIKIVTIIINFIAGLALFIEFYPGIYSTEYFMLWLPQLLISIVLIIYAIKSIINVIQNKIKINVIDIIISGYFICSFITGLIFSIVAKY